MGFDIEYERLERKTKIKKVLGYIIRWTLAVTVTVVAAWAVTRYCLEITNMLGDSMNITLEDGDTIMINKLAYVRNDPERFDVIVFEQNDREHNYYNIKRVIGLPGEKVQIADGCVYINGELLDEPMNVDKMELAGLAAREMELDSDEFFVLGDNRNNCEDSRFTTVGNVVRQEIIGSAWLRTNQFGIIDKMNVSKNNNASNEEKKD